MLFPIDTDAPLYHFPWATIGLIVANVVCYVATVVAGPGALEPWLLEYGNGLNPLEWVPAAFAHADLIHLLGNMFFLWGFGLVVEGKLGWRVFLPLYMGMAVAWGAGVDLLTLHRTDDWVLRNEFEVESIEELEGLLRVELVRQMREAEKLPEDAPVQVDNVQVRANARMILDAARGRCLGASGVIFSLMVISLIWAPKNEMHIIGFLVYRPISVDVSILAFSLWYLGLNILSWLVYPSMGSSGLHLVGAVTGLVVGTVFLRRKWVDCEHWDLFAVMSGKYGRFAQDDWSLGAHANLGRTYGDLPLPEGTESAPAGRTGSRALHQVDQLIDDGDFLTAAEELLTLRLQDSGLCPDEERTRRLALGLMQAESWDDAEIWLTEFIERYPENNAWAKIRLAQLLVTQQSRPRAALKLLKGVVTPELPEKLATLARRVAKLANDQVRDGVQDAESEW